MARPAVIYGGQSTTYQNLCLPIVRNRLQGYVWYIARELHLVSGRFTHRLCYGIKPCPRNVLLNLVLADLEKLHGIPRAKFSPVGDSSPTASTLTLTSAVYSGALSVAKGSI